MKSSFLNLKKIKYPFILIAVFCFILLFVFLFFLIKSDALITEKTWQESFDITDWSVYTNEEYKFSLKFPDEFNVTKLGIYGVGCYDKDNNRILEECKKRVAFTGLLESYLFYPENNHGFTVFIYKNNFSLEEWVERKRLDACKNIFINNINGLMCIKNNKNNKFNMESFFFTQNNRIYYIEIYDISSEELERQNKNYKAIISTFKALD